MGPLPLLNFTASLYPEVDLHNVVVIACQHILGTLVDLLEELYSKGLDPKNVFILGKCYSTNTEIMSCFPEDTISHFSISFDPSRDYDDQYREYVEKFVDDCFRKEIFTTSKKILVLDDGGFLLQRVNEVAPDVQKVSGIEQTSSGLSKIKDNNLRFGIVNVARSEAKLQIESPLIAKVFVQELKRKISSLSGKRILIVGQGAIGQSLKDALKGNAEVFGCDSEKDLCDFSGNYTEQLATFDIVIGATGKRVFALSDIERFKDGCILVSASSSDREFPAAKMRVLSGFKGGCHTPINYKGKILLNAGFPLNFNGEKHSLPPEDAQLTRSLLLAGICESVNVSSPGLYDLSTLQKKIVEEFVRLKSE